MTGLQPWLRGSPAGRIGLRALAVTVVMIVLSAVFAAGAASAAAGLGTAARPTAQTPACTGACWIPGAAAPVPWQWELGHPLSLTSASDMGTSSKTYAGAPAPAPQVYDIDGIENPASTVAALHARGKHVICYIEVGAAGNYPGAYGTYFAAFKAAGVLGAPMSGYSENYLNINSPATVAIVEQVIHDQCYAKGFDAVEPDIDDSWYDPTGFTISMANEEAYLATLSGYAHSLGLSWGLKDGDQADALADSATFIGDLIAAHTVDWGLTEQSFQYATVPAIYPAFAGAGLALFEAEYAGVRTKPAV
jgi:hypothetical protein